MTTSLDALKALAAHAAAIIPHTREEVPDGFDALVQQASTAVQRMELDPPASEFTGDETDPQIPVSEYRLTKHDVVAANDIWSISHYLGDDYKKRIVSAIFLNI
jgi:hypothetical protein